MKSQLLFPSTWPATVDRCPNRAKHSASNINIWSQSSSCLSKYSLGEEKTASSQASCSVYYFSVWPLTYRQRKDSCIWKHQTCFDCCKRTERERESKKQGVGGVRFYRTWSSTLDTVCNLNKHYYMLKVVEKSFETRVLVQLFTTRCVKASVRYS